MPIRLLLEHDHAFGPDEIKLMVDAFEDALRAADLPDRNDPRATTMAKRIIELTKTGERDPVKLRAAALQAAER
jgi:hypothetical protein